LVNRVDSAAIQLLLHCKQQNLGNKKCPPAEASGQILLILGIFVDENWVDCDKSAIPALVAVMPFTDCFIVVAVARAIQHCVMVLAFWANRLFAFNSDQLHFLYLEKSLGRLLAYLGGCGFS
jgi:hypothetical protein